MNKRWVAYAGFAVGYVILALAVSVYLPNPFVSNPEAANALLNPGNLMGGAGCAVPAISEASPFGWLPDLPRGLPLPVYDWSDRPLCYSAEIRFDSSNAFGDALIWLALPVVGLSGFWLGRRSNLPLSK